MKYVLVETVTLFRDRYCVAVPDDLSDSQAKVWAQDCVVCEDAPEFSQKWIGENISSVKIMNNEEMLSQFREDNDWASSWTPEVIHDVCVLELDSKGDVVKKEYKDE